MNKNYLSVVINGGPYNNEKIIAIMAENFYD